MFIMKQKKKQRKHSQQNILKVPEGYILYHTSLFSFNSLDTGFSETGLLYRLEQPGQHTSVEKPHRCSLKEFGASPICGTREVTCKRLTENFKVD